MSAHRDSALASLVMIANDDQEDTGDRIEAACAVLSATAPIPSQADQDEALAIVANQLADVVVERLRNEKVTA